jgi:ribosomal protein S27E
VQNLLFKSIDTSSDPTSNNLFKIIQSSYEKNITLKEEQGQRVPFHIKKEFRKYLKCGILEYGFIRLRCGQCHHEKLVAFSCKARTLCPSCTGRTMANSAKHLLDEVIPPVSVRQWVLSLPYQHRYHLAYNPKLNTRILKCIMRAISTFYKKRAKKNYQTDNPKTGAITVIQRFGGALNLNTHFHILFMDGVYNEQDYFLPVIPDHSDIEKLVVTLKKRIDRILEKEGLLDDLLPEESSSYDDHAQSYHQLSILNLVEGKEGKECLAKPTEIGKVHNPPFEEFRGKRAAYRDGFSLHANSRIPGHARGALEKMCRYILRGPLAKSRIEKLDESRVLLKLKTPYRSGTTHLVFTNDQFISRLMALIPPPRMNLVRYYGVFGANHKKRKNITKKAQDLKTKKNLKKKKGRVKSYRTPWADLLKHVFKEDVMACARCGETLEFVATINDPRVAVKILTHLKPRESINLEERPRGPPILYTETYDDRFDDHLNQETNW